MKKNRIFLILILFTVFLSVTCKQNIGLGGTVDIERPDGQIIYPDAGETPIRGSFDMWGTAYDDEGVKSVSVVFKNKDTGKGYGAANCELTPTGGGSVDWKIRVNNDRKGYKDSRNLVNDYPIPDGEYEAIVTITDVQGKKTLLNKTYKIDNTPPVFIVSRPSTFVENGVTPASSSGDGYGAVFSVVGQVGEKNTVERLQVSVPDKDIDLTGMFVGKNINAQIAKFQDAETGAIYSNENNPNPLIPFKANMYLYDNAREFKGGVSEPAGNKAEWYYLSDAIYADVLSKGYTTEVISDYFAGKDASGPGDHNANIRKLSNDDDALDALKKEKIDMGTKCTTFRLDPRKSPGFRVVNINNLPKATLNLNEASSILFKDDVTTTVIVELMRNKDSTPLIKSTNLTDVKKSNIEIILLKWNGIGDEVESFKKGSELDDKNPPPPASPVDYVTQANLIPTSLIKFSDFTSQEAVDAALSIQSGMIRVKCKLPSGFSEGKYLVKVKGTDIDKPTGNTFTAYDDSGAINDGVYIINFLKNVIGPRIRPHQITGYHNAPFEVKADIDGLDGTSTVYYNIDAEVPAVPDPAKKLLPDSGNPRLYKATVPVAGLADGDHEIHFLARKGSAQDTISTIFKVDRTGPEAKLNYPDPNDPQVGEIEIGGTITDSYAGVDSDKTKWMIVKKTTVPTIATTSGWNSMVVSTTGSWKFAYNLDAIISEPQNYGTLESSGYYRIPVYILAQDKKGNKAVHTLHILFDKDGKKPVVKILSPKDNIKTGGTIQLFGTAKAPKGGPSAVGGVYIQFSKSGNFSGGEDGKFGTYGTPSGYDNDWYKGDNGQLIPGSLGGEWSLEINKDGQFNPPAPSTSHVVYYKLRGKHTDGTTFGNWSEIRKITIDKDTPVIRDVVIVKGSDNERYETNMWVGNGNKLKAQLADGSGLKKVEISSDVLGFKHIQTTESIPSGWTAMPAGWLTYFSANGESGYKLTLPIENLQNVPAAAGGKFKIKVEIWENTDQNLHTSNEFEFRFDTVNPSGSFGEYMLINTANFGTDSINDGSIASAVTSYITAVGNTNDLGILIKNTPVTITSVSGSTVNFSPNIPESGFYNYILYKKKTLIYNPGTAGTSKWVIHGVANDDGSGVKEVRAKVKVGSFYSAEVTISGTQISRQLGGQVTWSGNIDLSSLPDGSGSLHYQITDASGNTYNVGEYDTTGTNAATPVMVKNKPIKVSKVMLKTKIGGFEKEFANSAANDALTETTDTATAAKRDSTFDFVSSNFTFKDKDYSKIKVNFTGGEGTVKYKLSYNNSVLAGHNLKPIPAGGEISLTGADLTAIGNSNGTPKELLLELSDAASASAKITIKTLFEAIDAKPPVPVILPFHWISENDNSLYQNSRENGHIEIKADLTVQFTEGNSDKLMDRDDKVSGKISIRGTAKDDQVIKEILGQIKDFTFAGVSGATSGAETKLTEYDFSTKKFKDIGTGTTAYNPNYMPKPLSTAPSAEQDAYNDYLTKRNTFFNTNGWLFTITSSEFDVQTGHTVNWQLDWDSSKITGGVGTDKKITIKVKDQSTSSSHTVSKTLQVDVVPYVTALKRENRYNTHRSSSGAYNLLRGDTVTAEGFNLTGTVKATIPGVAIAVDVTFHPAVPAPPATPTTPAYYDFQLPATAKSGKVKITAGGVQAINNLTNNSKPYNRQDIENRPETQYWTDDLTIDVWKDDEQFTSSNNPKYPSMAMGSNGDLYAAYSNYSESKIYYSKLGGAPQSVYYGYDPPEEAAISVKDSGTVNILYSANYHGGLATSWGASIYGAGGLYCYDTNAPELSFYNEQGGKIYRFELFYHQKQLQQFKNFRIARKDNNIHIAYYDTLAASVKYSTVQSGTTNTDINFIGGPYDPSPSGNNRSEIAWVDLDGSTLADVLNDPNLKRVGTVAKLVDGAAGQFENGLQRTGGTTEYCAIALDGSNRPVVVYADVDKGTLRLARANAAEPKTAAHWKVQKVLPAGDANTGRATDYFAAQFDSAGYLHIVFRNTKGQICYVKSTNANAGASAYTFEKSVVIAENGSRVELTMDGTSPYVAYLSKTNAYDGIQIAYYDAGLVKTWKPDGSADQTGAWNIMTAAMKHRAGDARACIAVAPSSVTNWKAAVGYTPGGVYRVVKYIGN